MASTMASTQCRQEAPGSAQGRGRRQHRQPALQHSTRFGQDPVARASSAQQQRRRISVVAAASSAAAAAPAAAADPIAQADATPAAPVAKQPSNQPLPAPVAWREAGQGLVHFADGSTSFRVWAPHASAVTLQVVPADQFVPAAEEGFGGEEATAAADAVVQPGVQEFALSRHDDDWGTDLVSVRRESGNLCSEKGRGRSAGASVGLLASPHALGCCVMHPSLSRTTPIPTSFATCHPPTHPKHAAMDPPCSRPSSALPSPLRSPLAWRHMARHTA